MTVFAVTSYQQLRFGGAGGKFAQFHLQFFFADYEKARITEVQFRVMQAVAELYPDKKAFSVVSGYGLFDKVCGTDHIRTEFAKTYKFDSIKDYWRKDEDDFRRLSAKYYLYK